jgi:hypothetical protein
VASGPTGKRGRLIGVVVTDTRSAAWALIDAVLTASSHEPEVVHPSSFPARTAGTAFLVGNRGRPLASHPDWLPATASSAARTSSLASPA